MTYFTMYSYNFCWPVRTLRERDAKGKWFRPLAGGKRGQGGNDDFPGSEPGQQGLSYVVFPLSLARRPAAGTDYDQLNLGSGTLTLGGTATLTLDLADLSARARQGASSCTAA